MLQGIKAEFNGIDKLIIIDNYRSLLQNLGNLLNRVPDEICRFVHVFCVGV